MVSQKIPYFRQINAPLKNTLIIAFLLFSTIASATDYYISSSGNDANNGLTPATAWQTIAKVNASSFNPGDQILFNKGDTWRETLTIPSSGSVDNYITFGAYGTGSKPKIDAETTRDYCIVSPSSKSYITIDGLELDNAKVAGIYHSYWTTDWGNEPNWIIKNCTFSYCGVILHGANTVVQNNTFIGPGYTTGENSNAVTISGTFSSNCIVTDNTIYGFEGRGVCFDKGSVSPTVTNNIIHDCYSFGISFDGYGKKITGKVTATGNTVYNQTWASGTGIFLENCSETSDISKNLLYYCVRAISFKNYAASGDYTDQRGINIGAVASYNIIHDCNMGVFIDNASGIDIWNNDIYAGNGSFPTGVTIDDAGTYFVTDIDFRNNIVNDNTIITISVQSSNYRNHFVNFDYNRVSNISVVAQRGNSSYLSLTNLKNGGYALNSISTDPLFVSSTDFHLQSGSPAIGKGVSVAGLTTDYAGNKVNNPPSIGAYESGATGPPPAVYQGSVVKSATPTLLEITYDLSLANIVPAASAFSVNVNFAVRTVKAVVVSGNKVQLTLANPIVYGN